MNLDNGDRGLERIAFFSDAVMAIAITLLAIELKLPADAHGDPSIFRRVLAMFPHLISYVVSFSVVALFWEAHHRMFKLLRRYDRGVIWLNVLFLMFLGLLPFTTGIMGEHRLDTQALIVYIGNVVIIGFFRSLLWWYASNRQRLTKLGLSPHEARAELWRGFTVPLVFAATIPVAIFAPQLTQICWLLVIPVSIAGRRRISG